MAISGINTAQLPMLQANTPQVATAPMLQGGSLIGQPLLPSAALGVQEKPGIGTRLLNAMKAAVGELRGTPSPSALQTAQLAMQAQALPVAANPAAVEQPAATTTKKQGVRAKKVKSAKTWKTLKNPPKQQTEPAAAPVVGAQQPTTGLPTNAVQIPGATVYGYDASGNPVAPTMQQLGMTPTMLQGLTGYADAAGNSQSGSQVNATNQTNLSGMGSAMGVGGNVPVLGAPIALTGTSAGDTAPAGDGSGGTQAVTNRNSSDSLSNTQGLGYGYGTPWGGTATPYSPYGASMTGAYTLTGAPASTGGVGGFFSRLLGA